MARSGSVSPPCFVCNTPSSVYHPTYIHRNTLGNKACLSLELLRQIAVCLITMYLPVRVHHLSPDCRQELPHTTHHSPGCNQSTTFHVCARLALAQEKFRFTPSLRTSSLMRIRRRLHFFGQWPKAGPEALAVAEEKKRKVADRS